MSWRSRIRVSILTSFLVTLALITWVAWGSARLSPPLEYAPADALNLAAPSRMEWERIFLLRDYNTRIVLLGTASLGVAAGVIGSFTLLRKRALMGDALSHAMLPGIGLAFMIAVAAGGSGKNLGVLLLGATISGLLGLGVILVIREFTRLKEDSALGIVLSVFFGGGIAILSVAQRTGEGHAAGLESFIYGRTASMLAMDAGLIAAAAALVIVACTLLFKEFKLLCFDAEFCGSLGWRTTTLDVSMMALVVTVTVIGLQAVGLILMVALLIIPPAAARFWTEQLSTMIWLSAGMGALSGATGSASSALWPDLPSGAMIVLAAAAIFGISMVFGVRRGALVRQIRRRALAKTVRRQHLLRAAYEIIEGQKLNGGSGGRHVSRDALLGMRSWSETELNRVIASAARDGLLYAGPGDAVTLTEPGLRQAQRIVKNHRLWELFLISYADIAPSHVDRDADTIEHVLGTDMVRELESLLDRREAKPGLPRSPHVISCSTAPES